MTKPNNKKEIDDVVQKIIDFFPIGMDLDDFTNLRSEILSGLKTYGEQMYEKGIVANKQMFSEARAQATQEAIASCIEIVTEIMSHYPKGTKKTGVKGVLIQAFSTLNPKQGEQSNK